MILPVHDLVRQAIGDAAVRAFSLDPSAVPSIVIETPPRRALGDLAVPVAFELARRLRRAPRVIAQDLVAALPPLEGVAKVEAAPNGYINVFLDRAAFLVERLRGAGPPFAASLPREKTIVEHTAINPNKAAHIGHLRNAALGDTLGRLLRFAGVPVEIQNYIDDTGVQVADVVVGFRHLEGRTIDEVRALADQDRFDYYCWDLYARVTEWYEADASRQKIRNATLHDIEHGGNPNAEMAALIADRIVRCHLRTMGRMNVDYDLLTWEGDILRLHFWATAFEILRRNGSVFLQTEGRLAGCWVMRIDEEPGNNGSSAGEEDGSAEEEEQREKVIVRSNGVVTYVGKDIANQFWKLGLLGRDFGYRPFGKRLDGGILWATTSDEGAPRAGENGVPAFGRASVVYNVIDTRQSYLQKLLRQALHTLGHTREAERSIHFAYEMVALSHATARQLGYTDIDESRPFVEVSGRKGLGVKADDLLDRLIESASAEVTKRNPEFSPDETRRIGETIAVAAVRYFLVKFTRGKVIAFDIDEALSFEGETGPYLQYAAVRAANIFNKLREREGVEEQALIDALPATPQAPIAEGDEADELWDLVLEAARLDDVVVQAVRTLEPAVLAKYCFGLAQRFNGFYHKYPILNEERVEFRRWRAAAASYFRRQLTTALSLMGCDVPARM